MALLDQHELQLFLQFFLWMIHKAMFGGILLDLLVLKVDDWVDLAISLATANCCLPPDA